MIETHAFEFVEAVASAETADDIERLFLKYTECVGAELILCGVINARGGIFNPVRMFGKFHHQWFAFYERFHLFFDDAAVNQLPRRRGPYAWSTIIAEGGLTKSEAFVMNEPRNFGLNDGLAVPLHGPLGELIGVSISGEHFKPDRVIEAALYMMSRAASNRFFELEGDSSLNAAVPQLTKRQRECLMWIQRGKSNEDIADILEISPNTVKVHVEGAKRAFDVSTRLEAVVAARRFQLLGP